MINFPNGLNKILDKLLIEFLTHIEEALIILAPRTLSVVFVKKVTRSDI